MAAPLLDWLHILVRSAHVVAAILWIGDSFLFMWMDRALVPPSRPRAGDVAGEMWMVHSGGFYEVVKRRRLAPDEMPPTIHWFMWEAYSTWITGIFLFGLIYWTGAGMFLVDPAVRPMAPAVAIAASVGLLIAGVVVYELLWSSPLGRTAAAPVLGTALLVATIYGLTHLFSARGAFIQTGAMLGTIMAANVAYHIIPVQRKMLAATREGRPVDVTLGARAKMHSIHNHYLTFPVVIAMLSNHFPVLYGNRLAWLVLTLLFVFAVALKYVMNARGRSSRWAVAAGIAAFVACVALTTRAPAGAGAAAALREAPPVAFAEARAIIERRCQTCHATRPSNPSFPQPPNGVVLEDPARIHALAPRILERAVVTKTMPLGNLTGMTEDERRTLGAWIAQGAKLDGAR
jgi:uncharacterized membrane protein